MNFKKAALEPDCTQMRARKMETLYSVATKEPSGCCSGEERRMVTGTLDTVIYGFRTNPLGQILV